MELWSADSLFSIVQSLSGTHRHIHDLCQSRGCAVAPVRTGVCVSSPVDVWLGHVAYSETQISESCESLSRLSICLHNLPLAFMISP